MYPTYFLHLDREDGKKVGVLGRPGGLGLGCDGRPLPARTPQLPGQPSCRPVRLRLPGVRASGLKRGAPCVSAAV